MLQPTESQILKAIGDWLHTVLPDGFQVLAGQQNQTAQPLNPVAIMTIVTRARFGTNRHRYNDDQTETITQPLKMGIQINLFGQGAGDGVVQLNTAWRDDSAVSWFRENRPELAPMFASDPIQHGFITAEKQYEDSWSLDLMADVETSITRPIQSAIELNKPALIVADTLKTKEKDNGNP